MRKFTVGKVTIQVGHSRLSYFPNKGARIYQAAAGLSLAAVSLLITYVIWMRHPLQNLLGEGGFWNTAATLACLTFTILMAATIPFYLKGSLIPFVFNYGPRSLCSGSRLIVDLHSATHLSLEFRNGLAGEYSSVPTWSLVICDGGKRHTLPLLEFDQKADADRVALQVASFLGLPVI